MLGFEHVGDYETESATTGMGADVQRMGHELSAACCEFFGWDPERLKFHYEDPNTDHACPGGNMKKGIYIDCVQQTMGEGGDHDPEPQPPAAAAPRHRQGRGRQGQAEHPRSASSSSPIIGASRER